MASNSPNSNRSTSGDTESLSLLDLVRKRLHGGVLVMNAAGALVEFSDAVPVILGVAAETLKGGGLSALPSGLAEALRHCQTNERAPSHHEVVVLPQGRQSRRIELNTLRVGSGEGALLVVSIEDHGAVDHAVRRIDQLDRLASVGMMTAGVCHEIKNAMVPVKTFVDLLLKENHGSEMAGLVARELRRIDSLVSQMLRFAGPTPPVYATFHLHEVLDHTLKLVEQQALSRTVSIRREFAVCPDVVRGDHYQIQQAFLNLALNAIEAMPSGGILTLSSANVPASGATNAHGPAMLAVSVTDTGSGIAPDDLAKLFEPFFTTKSAGNGLGLAITQRIIREHGGEITVESSPGRGTRFTVSLPGAGLAS